MKDIKNIPLFFIPYLTICGGLYQISFWDTFNINGLSFLSLTDIIKSSVYPIIFSGFIFIYTLILFYFNNHKHFESLDITTVKTKSSKTMVILFIVAFTIYFLLLFVFNFKKEPFRFIVFGFLIASFISSAFNNNRIFQKYFTSYLTYLIFIDLIIFLPIFSFYIGKFESYEIKENFKYKYTINKKSSPNNSLIVNDTIKLIGKTENHFVFTDLKNEANIFIKNETIDTLLLFDKNKRRTTFGLAIAGLTCIFSSFVLLSTFVPADGTLFNFLFIISILVILIGCGNRLDLIKPCHRQAVNVMCHTAQQFHQCWGDSKNVLYHLGLT